MADHSELKRLAKDVNSQFPEKEDLWSMVCTPTVALELIADIERLKTEIAGFKTGYEAYEQVSAGLRAEVEGLRNDAERYRFVIDCPIRTMVALGRKAHEEDFDLSVECDRLMGKGERS